MRFRILFDTWRMAFRGFGKNVPAAIAASLFFEIGLIVELNAFLSDLHSTIVISHIRFSLGLM